MKIQRLFNIGVFVNGWEPYECVVLVFADDEAEARKKLFAKYGDRYTVMWVEEAIT